MSEETVLRITPQWLESVRAAQKEAGVSQSAMAAMIGISQPHLSRVLLGKTHSTRILRAVCDLLSIEIPVAGAQAATEAVHTGAPKFADDGKRKRRRKGAGRRQDGARFDAYVAVLKERDDAVALARGLSAELTEAKARLAQRASASAGPMAHAVMAAQLAEAAEREAAWQSACRQACVLLAGSEYHFDGLEMTPHLLQVVVQSKSS